MKFSIIVPCFNSEKNLKACMDSIFNQSYDNFEVIIINDGSTDNTKAIIEEYQKNHSNIRYYEQENKGIAYTRNLAMHLVSGEYFIFVDSDDTINQDLLLELAKNLEVEKLDILRYQALIYKHDLIRFKLVSKAFPTCTGVEALKSFIEQKIGYGTLWMYCYNRDYVWNNNFQFEEGKNYEDFYNVYMVACADRIKSIDYIGYNYIINNYGITSKKEDDSAELKRANDVISMWDLVIGKLKELLKEDPKSFEIIALSFLDYLEIGKKNLNDNAKNNYERIMEIRRSMLNSSINDLYSVKTQSLKKNIIILGPGRSGKTSLANLICKKMGYNIVKVDDLVCAFERVYPSTNISHSIDRQIASKAFYPFLQELLIEYNRSHNVKNNLNYVIEGTYIDLESLVSHPKLDNFIVLGLHYSSLTEEEIFDNIRKYELPQDWTYHLTDEQVRAKVKKLKKENDEYKQLFDLYGIVNYDTSDNRNAVFNEIMSDKITDSNLKREGDVANEFKFKPNRN